MTNMHDSHAWLTCMTNMHDSHAWLICMTHAWLTCMNGDRLNPQIVQYWQQYIEMASQFLQFTSAESETGNWPLHFQHLLTTMLLWFAICHHPAFAHNAAMFCYLWSSIICHNATMVYYLWSSKLHSLKSCLLSRYVSVRTYKPTIQSWICVWKIHREKNQEHV